MLHRPCDHAQDVCEHGPGERHVLDGSEIQRPVGPHEEQAGFDEECGLLDPKLREAVSCRDIEASGLGLAQRHAVGQRQLAHVPVGFGGQRALLAIGGERDDAHALGLEGGQQLLRA